MKWRSAWPIYDTVQWFCVISWRLFDIWTSLVGSMNQYDPTFDLKINVGHWPIFHGPVILPYILKTIWYMNILSWKYESVWLDVWPQINVGHCDLYFMVHWFCLKSWRLFDVWTLWFTIMSQYDPMFDLKINIGHCDLYFIVQWFCVTSWRLFDVWTSFFGIMDYWIHGRGICLISSKTIWCTSVIFSDNETVWSKFWPQSKYKSTWPIFHGQVILFNVVKIIWWMNIIVGIMDQCDTYIDLIKYM